jgi:uncharacterized cupin superfamily protein
MGDRVKRRLGDACGLSHFGVNLVTLGPGAQSALRHWHTHEDELIYVLSGELILITNEGEQTLTAGMAAGFAAGVDNGHHFVNRSDQPARYLEIGDRIASDQAHYPDDDLMWKITPQGEIAAHKDGTLYDT